MPFSPDESLDAYGIWVKPSPGGAQMYHTNSKQNVCADVNKLVCHY